MTETDQLASVRYVVDDVSAAGVRFRSELVAGPGPAARAAPISQGTDHATRRTTCRDPRAPRQDLGRTPSPVLQCEQRGLF